MASLNKERIRKNIFRLLDCSGLTDIAFANLLFISEKQLRLIKGGKAEFKIDSINKACDFFKITFNSINNKEIDLDRTLRGKLTLQHKNNPEFSKILNDNPSITYAIDFELLENKDFISGWLEIKDIRKLFKQRGWIYSSSYTSLGINRAKDKIDIKMHPTKANTKIYTKK